MSRHIRDRNEPGLRGGPHAVREQVLAIQLARLVGTHHQLRGLLLEGVGATVLDTLGVTAMALHAASARLFGEAGISGDAVPPESEEALRAVAAAGYLARDSGHDHVGTEHLLFVLASDPGSRSRRLLNDLGVSFVQVKKELECYLRPARPAAGGAVIPGTPPPPVERAARQPRERLR